MPSCSHCTSNSPLTTPHCLLAPCGHCTHTLKNPPPISLLLTHFPRLSLNMPLDRTNLRCQHCDLVTCHKRVIDAERPPPTFENPVKKIEGHIWEAEKLIKEGKRKEELEPLLPYMRDALAEKVEERERRAGDAWKEYWGIWGKGEIIIEE